MHLLDFYKCYLLHATTVLDLSHLMRISSSGQVIGSFPQDQSRYELDHVGRERTKVGIAQNRNKKGNLLPKNKEVSD